MTYQELLKIKKYFTIFNELFNNKIVILHESNDLYYIKHNNNFILISEIVEDINNIPNLKKYLDHSIYFEKHFKDKPLKLFNIDNLQCDLDINFIQALHLNI
jgi:hypothetical protein